MQRGSDLEIIPYTQCPKFIPDISQITSKQSTFPFSPDENKKCRKGPGRDSLYQWRQKHLLKSTVCECLVFQMCSEYFTQEETLVFNACFWHVCFCQFSWFYPSLLSISLLCIRTGRILRWNQVIGKQVCSVLQPCQVIGRTMHSTSVKDFVLWLQIKTLFLSLSSSCAFLEASAASYLML